ncbi:MAG: hypothetical protein CMM23_00365 [Rhodospirillaceae bacterium]|nr:hypothetical protein [Rhodospirillaceae bacterium]
MVSISKSWGSIRHGFTVPISFAGCMSVLNSWSDRYRQRRHLATLDNRMLNDLGRLREQVTWECGKPFWWR